MSIVKLRKITLVGLASEREDVLKGLQRMGCLHLIDLPGRGGKKTLEHAARTSVQQAIHYLQASTAQHPQPHRAYPAGDSCLDIANQIRHNENRRLELRDEQDQLERNLELVRPWGEFCLPDVEETNGMLFWFYVVPRRQLKLFPPSGLVWQQIHQDRQFAYVVVLSASEPDLGISRVSLDPRPQSALRARLGQVKEELAALDEQRYSLTRWLQLLTQDLDQADDEIALMQAADQLFLDPNLFAVQAWVPKSTLPTIEAFARQNRLALTVAAPTPDETPPTLMKNPTVVAGAEGAVSFYITPAYRAWDPTWIMYLSFSLFFAMIMSDAAYGIIMGIGLACFWKRMSTTEQMRKLRYLFLALVGATIGYGIAIGSYFGATPAALEPLQLKVEGKPLATHQDAMMMLSLAIGIFHLCLANLISAWQNRYRIQALSSVGWALAFLGGFMIGLFSQPTNKASLWLGQSIAREPAAFQPLLKQLGIIGLVTGLTFVFLFSSSRPLLTRSPKQWLLRMLDGFLGLTKISSAFGDTLSYLRLFALGLASAQLAVTFNGLASGMMEGAGLGFLLAIVILLVGHSVNIVLGIMGGVVHGLRLNCIEFFNWSLTEEGYPFRPFHKKAG
jgi:V/A-type H+/Na+-transporting ATPase subunit I